uniref:Venom polypeptide n=1 Tax=Dolopus genitalis TaxID=2488630 RepID=A0A3G5BIB2_DOLGE|nr:venom polypeptide [Dolopus genitalis]
MKFIIAFLLIAGICATVVEEEVTDSQWLIFAKELYRELCRPEEGNRCVELTKETYKNVLKPYREQIKAKCKAYKAAGQFWLHWPCIAFIKTIPKA